MPHPLDATHKKKILLEKKNLIVDKKSKDVKKENASKKSKYIPFKKRDTFGKKFLEKMIMSEVD